MLFIGYYRVSTQKQGQSGLGLEAQQAAVRRHVAGQPGADLLCEFIEVESGTRNARPVLAEAMAECRRRKATLCIAKLDRLARNVAFVSTLLDSKVSFIACDAPHADRMFLQMLSVFAEHEARMISQRTKVALAAAKARGVILGSFGKELARRQQEEASLFARGLADPVQSAIRDGAMTFQAVADYLNLRQILSREGSKWYPSSVARLLKRLDVTISVRKREIAGQ